MFFLSSSVAVTSHLTESKHNTVSTSNLDISLTPSLTSSPFSSNIQNGVIVTETSTSGIISNDTASTPSVQNGVIVTEASTSGIITIDMASTPFVTVSNDSNDPEIKLINNVFLMLLIAVVLGIFLVTAIVLIALIIMLKAARRRHR